MWPLEADGHIQSAKFPLQGRRSRWPELRQTAPLSNECPTPELNLPICHLRALKHLYESVKHFRPTSNTLNTHCTGIGVEQGVWRHLLRCIVQIETVKDWKFRRREYYRHLPSLRDCIREFRDRIVWVVHCARNQVTDQAGRSIGSVQEQQLGAMQRAISFPSHERGHYQFEYQRASCLLQ